MLSRKYQTALIVLTALCALSCNTSKSWTHSSHTTQTHQAQNYSSSTQHLGYTVDSVIVRDTVVVRADTVYRSNTTIRTIHTTDTVAQLLIQHDTITHADIIHDTIQISTPAPSSGNRCNGFYTLLKWLIAAAIVSATTIIIIRKLKK